MIIYEHGQYSKQFLRDVDPDFPIEWLESLQKLQIDIEGELNLLKEFYENDLKEMETKAQLPGYQTTNADRAKWNAHLV